MTRRPSAQQEPADQDFRIEEFDLCAYLLAHPSSVTELSAIDPARDIYTLEARVLLHSAIAYNKLMARRGAVRYPTAEAVERSARELLSRQTGDQNKDRAALSSFQTYLDEVKAVEKPPAARFDECLDRIKTRSAEKRLRSGLLDVVGLLQDGKLEQAVEGVKNLAAVRSPTDSGFVSARLDRDAHRLLSMAARRKADPAFGRILTPFPKLNDITGGGRFGRMWLVSAYAKGGKTQFSMQLVYEALISGHGGLIATAEQTADDVMLMLTIRHTHQFIGGGVPYLNVINGCMTPEQDAAFSAAVESLEKDGAFGRLTLIQCPTGTTVDAIRAAVVSAASHHPVDFCVVDHTMLFSPSRRHDQSSEVSKLSGVLQELKSFALDYDRGRGLWMIATHQIKREGYEKALERKFYVPSDMAGSSEAERSADVGIWLFRDTELMDRSSILAGVFINRWGMIEEKGWEMIESFGSSAVLPLEEA